MNNLIVDNHVIKKDIKAIITLLRMENNSGKLQSVKYLGDGVRCTCPFHKDGLENRPSCNIYTGDDDNLAWGTFHCFTCGEKGSLVEFVAGCLNISKNLAKKWLKDNFTEQVLASNNCEIDDKIILSNKRVYKRKFDTTLLDNMQSWHPYMQKRQLSKEVCERFEVKYDPKTECIVFPVRDINGELSFLTRRSVKNKMFIIDANVNKDVYLLYDIIKNGLKKVYVAESQINALTLQSWNYPAIALFGTGTQYQYELLNKSGIIYYILCLDGDDAGDKGIRNFIKNIKNAFIDIVQVPRGKDINDLTKEEFEALPRISCDEWLKKS